MQLDMVAVLQAAERCVGSRLASETVRTTTQPGERRHRKRSTSASWSPKCGPCFAHPREASTSQARDQSCHAKSAHTPKSSPPRRLRRLRSASQSDSSDRESMTLRTSGWVTLSGASIHIATRRLISARIVLGRTSLRARTTRRAGFRVVRRVGPTVGDHANPGPHIQGFRRVHFGG